MCVEKRTIGAPWNHFIPATQPKLEMAQSSIVVSNDKEDDQPLGHTCGEHECVCVIDDI